MFFEDEAKVKVAEAQGNVAADDNASSATGIGGAGDIFDLARAKLVRAAGDLASRIQERDDNGRDCRTS